MAKPITYPINEHFYTWQGEGAYAGRAAYFIRSHGCPVKCSFCDSAGTWHPDYVPDKVAKMDAKQLARLVTDSGAKIVVVTGGEPALWDWEPLRLALPDDVELHMETSGAYAIIKRHIFNYVTLSPKWLKVPIGRNLLSADAIKLIVEHANGVTAWEHELRAIVEKEHGSLALKFMDRVEHFLHPEWSKRNDVKVLEHISEKVMANPLTYRAGYQLHKLYKVDQLDPNCQPAAPLGGNESNGY